MLYVGPPNELDRVAIFRIHLPECGPDVSLEELARLTDGYTGADIAHICREAGVAAIKVCHSTLFLNSDGCVVTKYIHLYKFL